MAGDVVRRQRLLEPGDAELGVARRSAQRLAEREALIRVHHDLESVAHRVAHRFQACHVVADVRLTDLDLGALEAGVLRGERFLDERLERMLQPAALGGVDRDALPRAAGSAPQRLAVAAAAQVP